MNNIIEIILTGAFIFYIVYKLDKLSRNIEIIKDNLDDIHAKTFPHRSKEDYDD